MGRRQNAISNMVIESKSGALSVQVRSTRDALRVLREYLNISQAEFGIRYDHIFGKVWRGFESAASMICRREVEGKWSLPVSLQDIDALCKHILRKPGRTVFPLVFGANVISITKDADKKRAAEEKRHKDLQKIEARLKALRAKRAKLRAA